MADKNVSQEQFKTFLNKIDSLEKKLESLEKVYYELQLKNKDEFHDLEKLVAKAVENGNNVVLTKMEEMEKRILILEQKDGEKAKAILSSIFYTSLGWLVIGILSNLPAIIGIFK